MDVVSTINERLSESFEDYVDRNTARLADVNERDCDLVPFLTASYWNNGVVEGIDFMEIPLWDSDNDDRPYCAGPDGDVRVDLLTFIWDAVIRLATLLMRLVPDEEG